MAEIEVLPKSVDPAGAHRAASALMRALDAGHDLGDRSHHIRAIGRAMTVTHQQLQQQLEGIREDSEAFKIVTDVDLLKIQAFVVSIEWLASFASSYQTEGDAA